jgi:surface antigen
MPHHGLGGPPALPQRRGKLLLAAILLAAAPAALSAQILVPPLSASKDRLSEDDMNRMGAAAARLSQGRSIGTVERWRNPDTRNAGSVKLVRQFQTRNMPCWRMEYAIHFGGANAESHQYLVNWCKTPEGTWKLLD